MKYYVRALLFSLGLAALLLMVTGYFSGASTALWNGQPCLPGMQYGFPLPFQYHMNQLTTSPLITHMSAVCPTGYTGLLIGTNFSYAILDYLFWFAISLPIVFGLGWLLREKPGATAKVAETEKLTPPQM
jgi:hypothetical protein